MTGLDLCMHDLKRLPIIEGSRGNSRNILIRIATDNGPTSEEIKQPTGNFRLEFDEFMVIRTRVNTFDRSETTQALDKCLEYYSNVETVIESVLLNLRVFLN